MLDMHYEVQMAKAENGIVLRVGCKVFVWKSWEELLPELEAYMLGKETEFNKKYLDLQVTAQITRPC